MAQKQSPGHQSTRRLEAQGWKVWTVERHERHGVRVWSVDCYNFADLIAFRLTDPDVVFVQCTGGGNFAARRRKILANTRARWWVSQPHHRILLHDWRFLQRPLPHWDCRESELTAEDFR